MDVLNQTVTLSNNLKMPILGFGTYNISNALAPNVIKQAIISGYRHLETAPIYQNEEGIKEGIYLSKIDRDQLFITSKVPPHIKNYESTIRIVKRSLKKMGLDYFDAVLINNPVPWGEEGKDYLKENLEVWRALETLYQAEIVGAIGISNFSLEELKPFYEAVKIKPHIHQIGIFIGHTLDEIRLFCHNNITFQAHSPLARGRVFNHDTLKDCANTLKVDPAQLAIKYVMLKGANPVVKTVSSERMVLNASLDFDVPTHIIETLDRIKEDIRDYLPPRATRTL